MATSDDKEVQMRILNLQRLRRLMNASDVVRAYMAAHQAQMMREGGGHEVSFERDLDADVLLGLAEVLSESREKTLVTFAQYVERNINPPVFMVSADFKHDVYGEGPGMAVLAQAGYFKGLQPGAINEYQQPRPLEETHVRRDDIRFMDFFRAFWRRVKNKWNWHTKWTRLD